MKTINLIACFCIITSPLFAADTPPAAAKPAPPGNGRKVEKAPNFIPTKADPLMGDWQGKNGIVAQVFPTADGKYQANLLMAFDAESNVVAVLQGTAADGVITFSADGWSGTIKDSHFTGSKGDRKFDLQHIVRVSPTEGAKPPAGAIVLFDGSNQDAWAKKSGKDWLTEDGPSKWKLVEGGAMEVVPDTDCIITHKKFGDCHVHVEFRTLGLPSNSGVFLEDRYEANINETYGRLTGTPNGGFDNCTDKVEPRIRPCFPPLAWQTFDIDFTAPKFDAGGNKTASARATVLFNGVKIYDNQELDLPHGAASRMGEAPTGPLMLQEHGMPVQFRNIWLVEKTH
ncbi:MAG TPA: DUF1080 domain-containing protein [Candidatus Acidoferrales bacterium]|jgi:hypothetical protein|nr:DUF1080 domain-containing protein [Candidatus Acidoferrales bacterium]